VAGVDQLRRFGDLIADRAALTTAGLWEFHLSLRWRSPGLYLGLRRGRNETRAYIGKKVVPRGGIEPPTHGFSVRCSTN
jgi:hypothetical protein